MSAMSQQTGMRQYPSPEEERRGGYAVSERGFGPPQGALLLVGLGAIGLGFLAWYYLGPDLVRYMKIRNM